MIADCIPSGNILYFSLLPFFPVRVVTCSPQMMSAAKKLPVAVLSAVQRPDKVLSEAKAQALVEQNAYPASIMALPWMYV